MASRYEKLCNELRAFRSPLLIRKGEAASHCGVRYQTFYRWVNASGVTSIRDSIDSLINGAELVHWLIGKDKLVEALKLSDYIRSVESRGGYKQRKGN